MSQGNVEVARRFTAAINAREVPEDLLAPEFRIENVVTAVTDGTYHGASGLRQWMSEFFEVLDEGAHYEAQTIAVGDDFAVGDIHIVGRAAVSGAPLHLRHYGVMWIRDGKITRAVGYPTRREALKAVGLSEQAMSQENVELVRRVVEAFNRGDVDAGAALLSEAKIVPLRAALEDVAYTGPNAFQDFWADATDAWSRLSIDVERFTDLGDRVLAIGWLRATARDTGVDVATPVGWVVTLAGGSVTEFRTYASRGAALEAVGLSEQAVSQENVEVVRRVYDAATRRDNATVFALYHGEVETSKRVSFRRARQRQGPHCRPHRYPSRSGRTPVDTRQTGETITGVAPTRGTTTICRSTTPAKTPKTLRRMVRGGQGPARSPRDGDRLRPLRVAVGGLAPAAASCPSGPHGRSHRRSQEVVMTLCVTEK